MIGPLLAGDLNRGLHQRPPEPPAARSRNYVELCQVALERVTPNRGAETQHSKPVGSWF